MEHPKNVSNSSLYQVPPTLKISWKSVQLFFRNVANRQADRQTNKAMDNDENITFAMAEVKIGTIFIGPVYKLFFSLTMISDVCRSFIQIKLYLLSTGLLSGALESTE